MSDKNNKHLPMSKRVWLRLTDKEYEDLKQEAGNYGYQISNLLRLRLFGKVNRVRNIQRPATDTTLLGDIIGKLTNISGELNKNSTNIQSIATRLSESCGDAFGLDFCLRLLERLSQELLKIFDLIEIIVRQRQFPSEKDGT